MTARHVAVIDIGKTNAKVVLLNALTEETLDVRSRRNEPVLKPLYPHYDLDGLWEFILSALREYSVLGVDAISITTHGAAAVIVDDTGPVLPALDYEFDGPDGLQQEYDHLRPAFSETLSPRLPVGLNMGAQLYWQAHTFPKAFARATAILMYPQYWAWKLTGHMASEVTSLGTHTDLWRPNARCFSTLVDKLGWRDMFPTFLPAASIIGTITDTVAEQTGLAIDTPVTCGIHDSNATLLPHLASGHVSVVASGTWTICMTLGGNIERLDQHRDCLANVDALGRPVPTARFMGGREFEILDDGALPTHIQDAVSDGHMILPTFTPGIGPFPKGQGREVGDIPAHHRAAVIRLYLALMTDTCLTLAGLGDKVIVEGPLARDADYLAILAALTDVPTYKSADSTGTTAGAALLLDDIENPAQSQRLTLIEPACIDGLDAYKLTWLKAAGS